MKNGANRTKKIRRNYKIQKTGRAELPTEINVLRPEKKTCPKIHEGKKCGREIWKGTKPQAQRRYKLIEIGRS